MYQRFPLPAQFKLSLGSHCRVTESIKPWENSSIQPADHKPSHLPMLGIKLRPYWWETIVNHWANHWWLRTISCVNTGTQTLITVMTDQRLIHWASLTTTVFFHFNTYYLHVSRIYLNCKLDFMVISQLLSFLKLLTNSLQIEIFIGVFQLSPFS